MTIPPFGALSLSGFAHGWAFCALAVVPCAVVLAVLVRRRRHRRTLRFANMAVLESVVPPRPARRWRHMPMVASLLGVTLLTTAMAGPTADQRIPRPRAVVMLVVDVSESMASTDVAPSRIEAAKTAGKRFAAGLTPGVSLGVVEFASSATLLVAPTTDRSEVARAIDTLAPQPRTATGEGILTALQAVASYTAVTGGGDGPPPARIVLESDGAENVPADPEAPRGAFTAARAARDQHVEISTISFGTPTGTVTIDGAQIPVPVDDATLQQIATITGGQQFHASTLDELSSAYSTLDQQIGYQTVHSDASAPWVALGLVAAIVAVASGLFLDRRVPA